MRQLNHYIMSSNHLSTSNFNLLNWSRLADSHDNGYNYTKREARRQWKKQIKNGFFSKPNGMYQNRHFDTGRPCVSCLGIYNSSSAFRKAGSTLAIRATTTTPLTNAHTKNKTEKSCEVPIISPPITGPTAFPNEEKALTKP